MNEGDKTGLLLLGLTVLCAAAFGLFCVEAMTGDIWEGLFLLYQLGTSLLPWLGCLWLSCRRARRQGRRLVTGTRWIWMALLGLYIALALLVTGAGTLADGLTEGLRLSHGELNLIPFSQAADPLGNALNLALGMPLGFLLPLLWPALDRFCPVLLWGLGASLAVELSQLVNFRATDVDDLLMNTAGALVGWGLFRLFARLTGWRRETVLVWPMGPGATLGALFLGRFLLYNARWLPVLLYGY